jgi:hypothetical protein
MKKELFVIDREYLERGPGWHTPASQEEALEMSIAKWETIVDHIELTGELIYDGEADTCALCEMYYEHVKWPVCCEGCPVAEHTGYSHCRKTPFSAYQRALEKDDVEAGLEAARKELEFLKSLRTPVPAPAKGTPDEQSGEALQGTKG